MLRAVYLEKLVILSNLGMSGDVFLLVLPGLAAALDVGWGYFLQADFAVCFALNNCEIHPLGQQHMQILSHHVLSECFLFFLHNHIR